MARVMAAYCWQNGMIMTFGHDGQQIGELQGRRTPELVKAILENSDENTKLEGLERPLVWPKGGFSSMRSTEG